MNETDALSRLSQWLKSYGWIVLQDKENKNNNNIFHVTGESTKKPDLIGISPRGYTIAIEVKSGDDGKSLGNYSKLMTYFENYNENKTFYKNSENYFFIINDFVIGTYYSPEGHLKDIEQLHIEHENSHRLWMKNNLSFWNELIPTKEYETTCTLIRRGIWDHIDRKKYKTRTTGIGALLSTALDDKLDYPAVFVMKPNYNTYKWRHLWLNQL